MRRATAAFVLALLLISTLGAGWGASRIEPETDFVDTVPGSPDLGLYREMLARLEGLRFVVVHMPHDPASDVEHLRTDAGFDAVVADQGRLQAHLEQRFPPGTFAHFLSVHEAMKAGHHMLQKQATAGHPPEDSYRLPDDEVTWQLVRDRVRDGDGDDVLAADGSSALVLAFLATRDDAEARDLAGRIQQEVDDWDRQGQTQATTDLATAGLLVARHTTDERNKEDLRTWGLAAGAGVLVALLWVLRRPSNVAIAAASMGVALVWTFGIMGLAGARISFLTVFLAPVVLGVGVDHAVHLLHRFEEQRRAGRPVPQAVAAAVRHTRRAVGWAAASTAAGLLVLALVPAPLFAQIGLVAALGTVLALAAALSVAPALRSLLPHRVRGAPRGGEVLARWAGAVSRRPAPALVLVALLTLGAGAVAASQDVASGQADNEFPADDPDLLLRHRIEQEYGAFERAYLIVIGDLERADALLALHRATVAAEGLPAHRDAASVTDLLLADEATDEGAADLVRSVALGTAGQAPSDEERLPATDAEARQRLDALQADPLWRTLTPFTLTQDRSLAVVAVQLEPWQDNGALLDLEEALQEQAADLREALGPGYAVAAGGSPVNRAAVLAQTPMDVALATLGAAGAVGLVLLVAWGRRGAEGVAMASTAVAVVLVAALWLLATVPLLDAAYGLLHGWGMPANTAVLNDMFLLAFAVTVAVGVDDVVHLAHRFWEARDAGAGRRTALAASYRHAGRAITGTSLTTCVGFAVLSGIYFLQSKNLAVLAALGALYAYLLTWALVPAVLVRVGRERADHAPVAAAAPDAP